MWSIAQQKKAGHKVSAEGILECTFATTKLRGILSVSKSFSGYYKHLTFFVEIKSVLAECCHLLFARTLMLIKTLITYIFDISDNFFRVSVF